MAHFDTESRIGNLKNTAPYRLPDLWENYVTRLPRRLRRNRKLSIATAISLLAVLLFAAPASAGAPKQFTFVFENGTTISGSSDDNVAFLAGAGGTDAANPTGMNIHVSCSDKFEGGFGVKDGPDRILDSAWRIESFSIGEVRKGRVEVKCSDSFAPPAPPPVPSIDLVKTVNGEDANTAPGVSVSVGETVKLGYVVTNDGNMTVENIVLTDADLGVIPCPRNSLGSGESMTCDERTMDVLQPGPVFMKATVDGEGIVSGTTQPSTPNKGKAYSFTFVNGTTISGVSEDNVEFLAGAGGTDPNNPIGMEVHVSCSDKFPDGFGEKDGPDAQLDSAWRIASFTIVKDNGDTCGDVFQPVSVLVSDMDPIHYIAIVDDPYGATLAPPANCSAVVQGDSAKITWDAATGATNYAVKRADGTFVGRTHGATTITDRPPVDVAVEYLVRSIGPDGKTDHVSCGTVTVPDGPDPTATGPASCTVKVGWSGASLSWTAVDGAKAYQVRSNGQWLVRTTNLSFDDPQPRDGYTVEAVFPGNVKTARTQCESA